MDNRGEMGGGTPRELLRKYRGHRGTEELKDKKKKTTITECAAKQPHRIDQRYILVKFLSSNCYLKC